MMGWLIPSERADEFEQLFLSGEDIPEEWENLFCWAEWVNAESPEIAFNFYG